MSDREESLKDKTTRGLFWGGMNNGVQQIIGLVFGIILGRWLSRDDFGMIAMITIFSLVANNLQASGFKTGLINLKEPRHEDYNSVFWFNVTVSLLSYAVLFFCAPFIAAYYHQPALVGLCRYAFLGFIFSACGLAQSAYLAKNYKFKELAICNMAATMSSSLVAVTMALLGCSYWSLATQSLIYMFVNTLLMWHKSTWRPTLSFDFGPVKRLFPFSVKIMITVIFSDINANIMNILLGRHFSARSTGDYNQAYQWSFKGYSLIQSMVKQVDQPVLVGLHNESERQMRVLRKMIRFTAFVSFPLLFGLGLVSHEFIVLTIGEKWTTSASLLPILCLGGAFMPLSALLTDYIISKGCSNIYMWCTIFQGICQLVLMTTLWPYGIRTMVWALVALNVGWMFLWLLFVNRISCSYGLLSYLKDTLPFALAAAAVMAITGWLTLSINMLPVLLLCRIILAAVLYYAVMRIARVHILQECQQFVLSKLGKKL